jgi:hypothetical protein
MKYDIVYADQVEELIAVVNNKLNDGWELLGRPWTERVSYDNLFWYQAMVEKPVYISTEVSSKSVGW